MSIVKLILNLIVIVFILAIIYSVYYLFVARPADEGLQILKDRLSELDFKDNKNTLENSADVNQPPEVKESVDTAKTDLVFLLNYARGQNIQVPEEIMELVRNGDTFVASSKLKTYIAEQVVAWKDLNMIQVVYQDVDEKTTAKAKQLTYNSLNKLVSNVKSGAKVDAEINLLKTSIDPSLVSMQSITKYDCTSKNFDELLELKTKVDVLETGQFTEIFDRNGYSYILVYASNSNKSPYCSLDEFIKANKK